MALRGRLSARTIVLLLGAVVSLYACSSLTGAGDLVVSSPATDAAADALPVLAEDGSSTTMLKDATTPPVLPDAELVADAEPPKACPSAGRRCVDPPPAGWQGPVILYDGPTAGAPTCPVSMALLRVNASTGAPTGTHDCTACSCGALSGVTCSAQLLEYDQESCSGAATRTTPLTTACSNLGSSIDGFTVNAVATGGTCAKSGGVVQSGAVAWPSALRACEAPALLADGCTDGKLCTPEASPPFQAQHCIVHAGDVACVGGWAQKKVGYLGVNDTRGCSACTCNPTNVACTGTALYFDENVGCNVGVGASMRLATCSGRGSEGDGVKLEAPLTPTGSCTLAGPTTKTGAVQPKDPVTLCCL